MDFNAVDSFVAAEVNVSTVGMIGSEHLTHGKGGEVAIRVSTRNHMGVAVLGGLVHGSGGPRSADDVGGVALGIAA